MLACVGRGVQEVVFEHVDAALRADRSFILAACSMNGSVLKYAAEALQADVGIVRTAVTKDVHTIIHASPSLQQDRAFVLALCAQRGYALMFLGAAMKADKAVALAACAQDGSVLGGLRYGEHHGDRRLVLAAVRSHANAFHTQLAAAFWADKEVVLAALSAAVCTDDGVSASILSVTTPELRVDADVVRLAAASADPHRRAAIAALHQRLQQLRSHVHVSAHQHTAATDTKATAFDASIAKVLATPRVRLACWHCDWHWMCTRPQRESVMALLVVEVRIDGHPGRANLPPMSHDLWLLILQFLPRHELGPPQTSVAATNASDPIVID